MIENLLKDVMSNEEFQECLIALEQNKNYRFNKNGLNLEFKTTKNGFETHMTYEEPTQKEVDEFTRYCENIDDELFVNICEFIGKDGLNKIQDCLDSNNIESVRSAVQFFRNNAKDYVSSKINAYKEIYKTL